MKKSISILKIAFSIILIMIAKACVNGDEYGIPNSICIEGSLTANTTFADVKALYKDEIVQIQEDLVIEGYVISSDEAGNFFGTLHFQDKPVNPTEGFQIDIDVRDNHLFYSMGEKILIKLKGLYLENSRGVFKVGGVFRSSFGTLSVGRLPATKVSSHLFVSCNGQQNIVPKITSLNELNDGMINTLVSLENMEVAPESLCKPYAEPLEVTDRALWDCEGNEIVLRNSGYADFQADILPTGNGTITAVLGKYNDAYQLFIRDVTDVKFDSDRCNNIVFTCEPPQENASIQDIKNAYNGGLSQITENLIVEAIITANDASGNFSRLIYIQDETGGIRLRIDDTKLFEKGYEIGKKIRLLAKDLYIDSVNGELHLGTSIDNKIANIQKEELYRHIYLLDEIEVFSPSTISLNALSQGQIGSLVTIEGLQFVNEGTFVVAGKNTVSTLTNCEGVKLNLNTNRFFDFGDAQLPLGNGIISGILSYADGTYQFYIRDLEDVAQMTDPKCDVFDSAVLNDVQTIRNLYSGTVTTIKDNRKLKAMVASNKNTLNIQPTNAIVQDVTAGIALHFSANHNLNVGDEVEIALLELKLERINGLLTITNIPLENIISIKAGVLPVPKTITLAEAATGGFESQLVTINDVQFQTVNEVYNGTKTITDCTDVLELIIRPEATFSNEMVNEMNGSITGVMSVLNTPYLYIREINDVGFINNYVDCTGGVVNVSNQIIISEIADPNNYSTAANSRFIELSNIGDKDVDLTGWVLRRYTNANIDFTSTIDLSGVIMNAGTSIVIAADAVDFETVYGFAPNFQGGANSAAGSNGDDNMELVDATGTVIDVFGVPGEDGTGTNHEFENGKAVRNMEVAQGNPVYVFSEWTIVIPQNAPVDFTPGVR